MASLLKRGNSWTLQLTNGRGRRKTVGLGLCSKRQAESVKLHVENLVTAHLTGTSPDPGTARWLGAISLDLRRKLAASGIVAGGGSETVGTLAASYLKSKKGGVASGTYRRLQQAETALLGLIGGDTPISNVTQADADRFRESLLSRGLAEATVRKRCGDARAVFERAVRDRLIESNPFAAVPTTVGGSAGKRFISVDEAGAIMAELPSPEWRLLFALGRWGGFRIPSEASTMNWSSVSWSAATITVYAPKTSRERVMPLYPELVTPLRDALESSETGEDRIYPWLDGQPASAVRRILQAAIKRAGVRPWPNLWRALRSTRQTELEQRFPTHVVCSWMGNSTQVAARSYLQVTAEDFAAASALHEALHGNASLSRQR